VDLITDSAMAVSARVGTSRATGIVQPKVGEPNDLLMQYLPEGTPVNKGEYVVTSGSVGGSDDSLYPPGLLIGQVTSVNEESAYESVNVRPFADLHNLDLVEVLTAVAGSRPANLARLVSNLPGGQQSGSSAQGEQLASIGAGG
jgi:rod shape-determining protein MreC